MIVKVKLLSHSIYFAKNFTLTCSFVWLGCCAFPDITQHKCGPGPGPGPGPAPGKLFFFNL